MVSPSYSAIDALGRPGATGTMISAPTSGVRETPSSLGDFLPETRKRKIEEVDGHPPDDRVRLGMQFSHEGSGSGMSPTSYRTYSDYPRSSYPSQMPAPATTGHHRHGGSADEENASTMVRLTVKERMLEQVDDPAVVSVLDCTGAKRPQGHGQRPVRGRVRKLRCRVDVSSLRW
jgi:hypothetical protein